MHRSAAETAGTGGRVERKDLGAWYTPHDLVATVVAAVFTPQWVATRGGRRLRVLDPSCGDGRFLAAVAARARSCGMDVELVGIDVDPAAVAAARVNVPGAVVLELDALSEVPPEWSSFDLVIGNPPYLSQMASRTTRGGASARGGGPYADAAVEFLALAAELVDPHGGRVTLVLPQSVLSSRDAAGVRTMIARRARMVWSWWSPERVFDAQVHVCVVAFEFDPAMDAGGASGNWSHVVTDRRGVPVVPDRLDVDGSLGDRARLNANFRDEYYGMAPAVGDQPTGAPLVTSALIDPGRSLWGDRQVTFAKRRLEHPRIDLDLLDERMRQWADRRLVPKVLVANQTRIIEAVCDPAGNWLPGVPVIAVYPRGIHWDDTDVIDRAAAAASAWEIAAVLTSPLASAWCWHRAAGTGLSADAIRLSPTLLADLPWPRGDLAPAVERLGQGDVRGCATSVLDVYGVRGREFDELFGWWVLLLERIEARQIASRPRTGAAPAG